MYNVIVPLVEIEQNLPGSLRNKMLERIVRLNLDIQNDVGTFLHNLDSRIHTDAQIRAAVKLSPDSLLKTNSEMRVPIQVAVRRRYAHAFVPLLAELAIELKKEVGGPDKRGGLLIVDTFARKNVTVLEIFVCVGHRKSEKFDVESLENLKKLKEKGLLDKSDIQNHKLLLRPNAGCQSRIEYLADLNPQALEMSMPRGSHPLWSVISKDIARFKIILKCCVKHYPNEIGFLFTQTGGGDDCACKKAIETYGKEEILAIIQECIPSNKNLPILHFVIKSAPHLLNDFALRYPNAMYLRNNEGQLLHHVALANGTTMRNNAMFFLQMSDGKLEDQDPKSGLHPFMLSALGKNYDLYTVFYLLRRNPSVLDRSIKVMEAKSRTKRKAKKGTTKNSKRARLQTSSEHPVFSDSVIDILNETLEETKWLESESDTDNVEVDDQHDPIELLNEMRRLIEEHSTEWRVNQTQTT